MKFLVLFVFFHSFFDSVSQNNHLKFLDSTYYSIKIDSLRILNHQLKNITLENEIEIRLALSYFPDLKCKEIIFKERKIKTTLNARPTIGSLLFSKKNNRSYVIRINTHESDSVISLNDVPFEAKIGLFAHEFSHFSDYQSKSLFGIIARGISYSSKISKAKFEKEIDFMTIQRGLGWQLYDWSNFIQNESCATYKYKKFKLNTYLTPLEILKVIQPLTVQ